MSQSKGKAASGGPGAAARSETGDAALEGKTFQIKGLELELPAKLPFRVLQHLQGADSGSQVVGILESVIGSEQLEQVWDLDLDMDEGLELVKEIARLYGTTLGK